MASVYFDVTDIVLYARRNNTVVGIPRVELNIVSLLATKYGGGVIRCVFFDQARQAMIEFDPSQREPGAEFDGESLLIDLGLAKVSKVFPSDVQIKSYLKRYNNNKPLRSLKKLEIYLCSLLARGRLAKLGISPRGGELGRRTEVRTTVISSMPPDSSYVCLGAVWFLPEVWQFALEHKQRGGVVVQMVHDLIPFFHPEYYSAKEPAAFKTWIDHALSYATAIACNSEWTERDLRRYAGENKSLPKIVAIPLAHEFIGYDRLSRVSTPNSLKELEGARYILCVGTIEHRKNGMMLLQVWKRLQARHGPGVPLLVFAGKYGKGGMEVESALNSDQALQQLVRVIHAPSDQDLAWLYQNCVATIYPSTFEGWGLPVGESAWFGKYCIASSATSIPEVCGDLLDYVDPQDVASIVASVVKVISDAQFLAGRERKIVGAKLKTWADVADEIFALSTELGLAAVESRRRE